MSNTITAYRSNLFPRPIYQSDSRYFGWNISNFATNCDFGSWFLWPIDDFWNISVVLPLFIINWCVLVLPIWYRGVYWNQMEGVEVYNSMNFAILSIYMKRINVKKISNTPILFLHSLFIKFWWQNMGLMKNWPINIWPIKLINRPITD
jgi:hypothetical protein